MATKVAADCASCGNADNLKSCGVCSQRLSNKGTAIGLCTACFQDPTVVGAFGKQLLKDDESVYECRACTAFLERREQEKQFQKLKGPSPEQILKTVANKFPWTLEITRATPEEHLEALQFLKRKLSGHRTVQALAESLANNNAQAALLMQQLGQNLSDGKTDDTMSTKVLRTFVKNQCPVVKYESLLVPPGGSMYTATRHFQEMLKVEDKLVQTAFETSRGWPRFKHTRISCGKRAEIPANIIRKQIN